MRFLKLYWLPISLFAFEVFAAGQGVIAGIIILVIFIWFIPKALFSLLIKNKEKAKKYALRSAVYFLTVAAMIFGLYLNNQLAEQRSKIVIAALDNYKAQNGRFPDKLEELVPKFLPKIPLAKINVYGSFRYYVFAEDRHTLMYVVVPPFGRKLYNLEKKSWSQLD